MKNVAIFFLIGLFIGSVLFINKDKFIPADYFHDGSKIEDVSPVVKENNMIQEIKQSIVTIGGESFKVELAQTSAERAQGLSGRDPLAEDAGMLFVFDEPAVHGFWMKDMKFALDIIWIMDGKVVDIWQDAPPPTDENIPRHRPEVPAEYVLEVNAGFVERSGLKIGDPVSVDI